MPRIVVNAFPTLDRVMRPPGGPDGDRPFIFPVALGSGKPGYGQMGD